MAVLKARIIHQAITNVYWWPEFDLLQLSSYLPHYNPHTYRIFSFASTTENTEQQCVTPSPTPTPTPTPTSELLRMIQPVT